MDLSLNGKHAVVCGGSQGIGLASAQELARNGAIITLVARNLERLETARNSLERVTEHSVLAVDFSKPEDLHEKISARIVNHPAQILINNTGGPPAGSAHTATLQEYQQAFSQHVLCNQVLLQALLPGMRAAGYGRIINIISTSVKQPIPGLGVSNTIRGAVASWAKTLATELGPEGITVNNMLPGFTQTGRLDAIIAAKAKQAGLDAAVVAKQMRAAVPAARFADASEAANAIAFLASPAAAYINGINLPVDGGRTSTL